MVKKRYWQIVRPLLGILVVSVVFGMSVLAVTDFGSIAVAIWCVVIAFLVGIYFSDTARERIYNEFLRESTNGNQPETTESSEKELRDFIYLDSLTVQSLLASLNVAIPQETTELSAGLERVQRKAGLKAGIPVQGVGKIGGTADLSRTDAGIDLIETSKKINDQFIFDRLYDELESRGEITSLPDKWDTSPDSYNIDENDLDIVKIVGKGKTDPIYRMANVLSLISRIEILQEYDNRDDNDRNLDLARSFDSTSLVLSEVAFNLRSL